MSAYLTNTYRYLFIIDDDIEDQEIFIEAVKELNESITCGASTSGEDALLQLENAGARLPDLIFLDMNMPKLNGKQVLKELKKRQSLRDVPVIMYSTSFAPRDVEEVEKFGAVFHLLKPSKFGDLCNALRDILSRDWRSGIHHGK